MHGAVVFAVISEYTFVERSCCAMSLRCAADDTAPALPEDVEIPKDNICRRRLRLLRCVIERTTTSHTRKYKQVMDLMEDWGYDDFVKLVEARDTRHRSSPYPPSQG